MLRVHATFFSFIQHRHSTLFTVQQLLQGNMKHMVHHLQLGSPSRGKPGTRTSKKVPVYFTLGVDPLALIVFRTA